MKEIDDTPVPESENEPTYEQWMAALLEQNEKIRSLKHRIRDLEEDLARFLAQRVAEMHPDDVDQDPEWY